MSQRLRIAGLRAISGTLTFLAWPAVVAAPGVCGPAGVAWAFCAPQSIAAAGNGQYAFPGNMPEVISAGGVFYTAEGDFAPSDVASHFTSSVFPGRVVPDLCGLVGNLPYGRLLLVPVPPKARLAKRPAFSMIAAGEPTETQISGWAMFSGTSGAASMIAGAAALLLQQRPELSPREIKQTLMNSSRKISDTSFRVLDVGAALEVNEVQETVALSKFR